MRVQSVGLKEQRLCCTRLHVHVSVYPEYTRVWISYFYRRYAHAYMCTSQGSVCVGYSSNDRGSATRWRMSVALNACYHGNRRPAHKSGTQTMVSLVLSLSVIPRHFLSLHPAALPIVYQFSLSPHPFILSASCLDFHSFLSVSCRLGFPPPPLHLLPHSLLFIQSDIFTSVSIHSCQPCDHPLTRVSLSHRSLHLSRHPLCLFPLIHLCLTCSSSLLFLSISIGDSVNLCIWRAAVHKKHTNARRHFHQREQK